MPKVATWVFQQLGGDKNKLELAGWSAPHGRPYHSAVARDGINVRHKSTRYPGSSDPPTRHILGINYQDITLRGRFRDRELGEGGAQNKVYAVKSFIKDLQPCDISWGDILHVTGFIEQFDPGRESAGEVEWTMKILVDKDNISEINQINRFKWPNIAEMAAALDAFTFLSGQVLKTPGFSGIRVNILDALDDLISSVTGAFGQLVNISNQIGNFESGLANEAKHLIAGVHQARTALLHLMDTVSSTKQDELFIRDSAKDTVNFNNTVHAMYTEADIAFAILSDIENQSLIRSSGEAKKTVRAHDGDTWESISIKNYGSSSEANRIRQANNVRYGRKPKPGELVTIPKL